MLDGLNEFSQRFCETLFSCFPEFRDHAKIDESQDVDPGTLVVEVPCANDKVDLGLWISTENTEVTIGFDSYHGHFGSWTGASEKESFRDAIEFVRKILHEEALAVAWFENDKPLGETWIAPGSEVNPGSQWNSHATNVRVRSWLGTYDEDRCFAKNV